MSDPSPRSTVSNPRLQEGKDAEFDAMTEIAALYYADDVTQEDLSQRFGMSRAKIGRLLKRAREEGIVEIRVRPHRGVAAEIEQEFVRRFGIERLIVAADHRDLTVQRAALAALVAAHLNRLLRDGMIVAVGMGRNVGAVADGIVSASQRSVTFVSAIGGSLRAGEIMNPDHICRRLASRFGGESETLYVPALVDNTAVRSALMQNETVRQTLDRARRADFALIGVGDLSEDSNMVRMGWFTPQEITQARLSGTIGDMMGYDFFDIQGNPTSTPLQERIMGLTTSELRRIPNVIAVASESTKAAGILGALRTGTINTLATSLSNAHTVLSLDQATRLRPVASLREDDIPRLVR